MKEIDRLLTVARSEIGYGESGDNITKYAAEMDTTDFYNGPKNGYAWCAVFVGWCFYKAFGRERAMQLLCIPPRSDAAGCNFAANYFKAQARWSLRPAVGAQVFFRGYAHTGIVEAVNSGTITTIEGNAGDHVVRRQYSIGDGQIDGYGIPDFADDDTEPVSEMNTAAPADPEPVEIPEDEPPDPGVRYIGMLQFGAMGDDVKLLQALLEFWGYSVGRDGIDGEFGPATESALVQFQQDQGLEVDGIAGPMTFGRLLNIEYCGGA